MGTPWLPYSRIIGVVAATASFVLGVLVSNHLVAPASIQTIASTSPAAAADSVTDAPDGAGVLSFPPSVRRLQINVGPNYDPLTPPEDDPSTGVLAVEAQLHVASDLRERVARAHPDRFFVISAALAGEAHVGFQSFHMYNNGGVSSSLASATANQSWAEAGSGARIGRGVEFVPVLTLGRLLKAIPPHVTIPLLKTDTQGFDFTIIKSADRAALRRVDRVMAEVYQNSTYYNLPDGVVNDLSEWVPHMERMGFQLTVPPHWNSGEGDAHFDRIGDP
ncbi:hypothetical protein MMPV_005794 [Pyropia vietnamensis]